VNPAFPILFTKPWYFLGSALDLDFQNNRAAVGSAPAGTATSQLTLTRTTVGYAQSNSGVWQSFASGAFRITDKGLLVEEARTNSALWSRDMTNAAWVKVNMTAALTATGIDGTVSSASTLTATAGNATVLQTITSISQADTYSVWLMRVSGSGVVNISLDGVAWTPVAITTTWTRFSITSTLLNPNLGIQIVTNGDVIAADFNQAELAQSFATSPILTTTVAVTRNSDQITVTNFGLTNFIAGTWYAEWQELEGPTSIDHYIFSQNGSAGNAITARISTSNVGREVVQSASATTASSTTSGTVVRGTVYRNAMSYQSTGYAFAWSAALNAAVQTSGAAAVPVGNVVSLEVGKQTSVYLNGILRRLVWSPTAASSSNILSWAQGTVGP